MPRVEFDEKTRVKRLHFCNIDGCGKKAIAREMCSAHYNRWRSHGSPMDGRTAEGEPKKFFELAVVYDGDDCLIWPFARSAGYARMWKDGKLELVSRLVCERIRGKPPSPHHQAAHECGKGHTGCISPNHLNWKTRSGNAEDALKHGAHALGENANSKLTTADVIAIRASASTISQTALAKMFGIGQPTVGKIIRRVTWKHIP